MHTVPVQYMWGDSPHDGERVTIHKLEGREVVPQLCLGCLQQVQNLGEPVYLCQ